MNKSTTSIFNKIHDDTIKLINNINDFFNDEMSMYTYDVYIINKLKQMYKPGKEQYNIYLTDNISINYNITYGLFYTINVVIKYEDTNIEIYSSKERNCMPMIIKKGYISKCNMMFNFREPRKLYIHELVTTMGDDVYLLNVVENFCEERHIIKLICYDLSHKKLLKRLNYIFTNDRYYKNINVKPLNTVYTCLCSYSCSKFSNIVFSMPKPPLSTYLWHINSSNSYNTHGYYDRYNCTEISITYKCSINILTVDVSIYKHIDDYNFDRKCTYTLIYKIFVTEKILLLINSSSDKLPDGFIGHTSLHLITLNNKKHFDKLAIYDKVNNSFDIYD